MLLSVAAGLIVLFSSCNKTDDVKPSTEIHVDSNVVVGNHLVDKDGRSLYYFSNDANGISSCTGGCLTAWPFTM